MHKLIFSKINNQEGNINIITYQKLVGVLVVHVLQQLGKRSTTDTVSTKEDTKGGILVFQRDGIVTRVGVRVAMKQPEPRIKVVNFK